MRRIAITPRENWQATVESQGFHFHTADDQPYWDECACYAFTRAETDLLEKATYELNDMCLKAVEHVLSKDLFDTFQIPPAYRDWLRKSWDTDEHTIYGRFDLAFSPGGVPKLLEYNADTPTALLEAAVIQWYWLQDTKRGTDQFNNIHERLIEIWKILHTKVEGAVYFTSLRENLEDYMTVNYVRDTAMQAGLSTEYLAIEDIAWNQEQHQFVDAQERPIYTIFKLYPWEWMFHESFGPNVRESRTRWFEPPWKVLLSNKAILPILWQLFPASPYLVRAEYERFAPNCIRKPMQGREGANVTIFHDDRPIYETEGPYTGPAIFQEVCPLANFDGNYSVIGSWIVNGYACGIGVREDIAPVTKNTSRFVPHYVE